MGRESVNWELGRMKWGEGGGTGVREDEVGSGEGEVGGREDEVEEGR